MFVFNFAGGHTCLDDLYTVAKILGFLAAALFFFYKFLSGYLVTNASIALACSRQRADDGNDHLAVIASVSKGDRGTIRIHDAQVRISESNGKPEAPIELTRLIGVERIDYGKGDRKLKPKWPQLENRFLNLSPGEKAQFVAYSKVPNGAVCIVEAVILGKLLWNPLAGFGQWRASSVSFPIKEEDSGLGHLLALISGGSHAAQR